MSNVDQVLQKADENMNASFERLFDFLRIDSISTDSAYAQQCRKSAEWCVNQLQEIGFDAGLRETQKHPMVVAHGGPKDAWRHLLFYGHYDVQPPDPLDLWETSPFEPHFGKGKRGQDTIVARGSSDDKGQLMTFVEAFRAWKEVNGNLPFRITVFFEGEEESGSPSMKPFLTESGSELKADLAVICDTGMWDHETPAITASLRGLLAEEIVVTGPNRDLHSGMYGGPARNPIRVLSKILADLHDDDGRIMIPGFYDGVAETSAQLKQQWDELNFSESDFLGDIGLSIPAGEQGRSVLEQIWARPTCDVNGIVGGYTGEGTKTVIPSKASAKLTFRLVGKQNPEIISKSFEEFVRQRLPADCSVEFIGRGGDGGKTFPTDKAEFVAATKALEAEFGKAPVMMGCGGSIPIAGMFKEFLDMDSMLIGFGLDDDAIHSPNEKYDCDSFRHGVRSWIRIMDALA